MKKKNIKAAVNILADNSAAKEPIKDSTVIIPDEETTCNGGKTSIVLNESQLILLYTYKIIDGNAEPYFDATSFMNNYKKSFPNEKKVLKEFWRATRTKELVNLIVGKYHHKKFAKKIIGKGKSKKTIVHKDLYLSLLIWLDARYELTITQMVEAISKSGEIIHESRKLLKDDTKAKNEAVYELVKKLKREYPNSKSSAYLYTNIQKGINRRVLGKVSKVDRENLPSEKILAIDELECSVENFIKENIDKIDSRLLADKVLFFIKKYKSQ